MNCNKEDCKYRSKNRGTFTSCDYILIEGHMRGCPIGENCDKYSPGTKKQQNWQSTLNLVIPYINRT